MTSPQTTASTGTIRTLLDTMILGNSVEQWLLASLAAVLALGGVMLARRVLHGRARALAERRPSGIFGLIPRLVLKTSSLVAVAAAVLAGSMWLAVGERGERLVQGVVVAVMALQAVLWGRMLIEFGLEEFLRRRAAAAGLPEPDGPTVASAGIIRVIALGLLYTGAVLLALDNFGVNVTAMIAGLGVGGIAVALAVQNILGDLFASLSIVLDKPFVVGDFIIVGDKLGTVERIGLKTTRLRALSGEQLVFSNSDLLSSRVQNFKRMAERRVVFGINIALGTPPEALEEVQRMLKEAVNRVEGVRLDRAHFKGFGAYALEFEIVYYVLSSDYRVYMDKQQEICLYIYRRLGEMSVRLALPAQTVFIAEAAARGGRVVAADGVAAAAGAVGRDN